jgi:hypothetical protein
MATYRVISERFSLAKQGASVDSAALEGYNVDALVSAGHLEEVVAKAAKADTTETPKDTK